VLTDTIPRETLSAWATHLRQKQPTFYFRSASAFLPPPENTAPSSKPKASEPVDDAIGSKAILSVLTKWASEQPEGTPLTVAVVGVTNVGVY
jgi:nuclear GTP-binding protein